MHIDNHCVILCTRVVGGTEHVRRAQGSWGDLAYTLLPRYDYVFAFPLASLNTSEISA